MTSDSATDPVMCGCIKKVATGLEPFDEVATAMRHIQEDKALVHFEAGRN